METSAVELEDRSAPVSKSELNMALKTMEKSILDNLAAIMRPMYEQMEKLQKDINENKAVANTALSVGHNNQKEIQQPQLMDDVLAGRALKMEITLRQQNLKIRGWPEKIEMKNSLNELFLDRFLTEVPPTGDLAHVVMKEVLSKRRELKPITSHLAEADIKYSWPSPLMLQFTHQGKTHHVTTKEGLAVLRHMNRVTPMDHQKNSYKRKHRTPSPQHQENREQQEDLN
ncbi:UNVERIFIED_CONTAM: hypothetical protein K2H54_013437 [Gekko kuhli]